MSNTKMYLDNLPRWEGGKHKDKINWKDSVGCTVKAEYEGIIYNLKILKNDEGYLYLEVDGIKKENPIKYSHFIEGKIGGLIGSKYIYDIGKIIKDEKRDLVILEQIRVKHGKYTQKGYKYHCNKCEYEDEISESSLKNGGGCLVCCGKKVILGFNTIWDTDKWAVDRGLISEEDAKKYTRGAHKRIDVICPNCGEPKNGILIYSIIKNKSIGCKKCGDKISFPEKVASLVFDKLNIYYEKQKGFNWSQGKIYDFFIPSFGRLVETHGKQHYENTGWGKCGGRTLAEEQENDRKKEELAIENELKYIPIDCRESNIDFIKENMIKMLGDIFDFSIIDWEDVDREAQGSLVWEVCEYWKNKKDEESVTDLIKYFSLDRRTIRKYLKKGTKYGWCFYNAKEEIVKGAKKVGANRSKKVAVYKDGNLKGVYPSANELERKSEQNFGVKFNNRLISEVCRGKRKTHKGYTFKYLE